VSAKRKPTATAEPVGWSARYATAIHEAGHVVVALALRRPFTRVWVERAVRNGGRLGSTAFDDSPTLGDNPRRIRARLTVLVAGDLAEDVWELDLDFYRLSTRLAEGRVDDHLAKPWTDLYRAVEAASWLRCCITGELPPLAASEEVVTEIRKAERRAAVILKRQWVAVEAIAAELCRQRSHCMTYDEVQHLLSDPELHPPDAQPPKKAGRPRKAPPEPPKKGKGGKGGKPG
jgi:hypothetical protein